MKEYKSQIDGIPNRIDEVSRNIKEVDYSAEELKLNSLKEQLATKCQGKDTAIRKSGYLSKGE